MLAHEPVEASITRATAEIEKNPEDARLYLKRGELHRVMDKHALAEADYARAAALDPDDPEVDFYLGRLFLAKDQPAKAEASLSRFIARDPGHTTARMLRARALVKLGRRPEAVEEYTAAIGLHGGAGPDLYLERAQALAGMGDAHLDAALQGLDAGLGKLGPVVTLELYAIELEEKRGNFSSALGRLDRILERSPRKDTWLARRGQILELAGRPAEAREVYEQALNAISKLPEARRSTPATADSQARLRDAMARLENASE
ncbi:MAG: tetratricopeptide repeat protein [Gemmatimonadales bacterium]|nr:tetratricopeptide repeat protein [Gemmatimonadales bacterium]